MGFPASFTGAVSEGVAAAGLNCWITGRCAGAQILPMGSPTVIRSSQHGHNPPACFGMGIPYFEPAATLP